MAKAKAPMKSVKRMKLPGVTFVREQGGISEYTLDKNGLRILLAPDTTVPVAGVMVTYHVGSRDEATGYTGATHILEHLLFKGSKKFNSKRGNGVSELLEVKGALLNATTWVDRTNYYEVVPKETLSSALALEADRMRHAFIREEDRQSEMTVVRNEMEMHENTAFEAVDTQLWALAFLAHPYHHSTIGWRSDVENVPIERLQKFYNDFYHPDNATLTVVGDFDAQQVLAQVAKEFGAHPRPRTPRPVMYTQEPKQEGERRATIKRADTNNRVGIAHKVPSAQDPDQHALLMLSLVLGDGKTSRLYRALVDTAKATDVSVMNYQLKDPSLLTCHVTPTPATTHAEIESVVKQEYRNIAEKGITVKELAHARQSIRSYVASRRDGPYALLSNLNEEIAVGDWTRFVTVPEALAKVTPRDIQRVAKKYLVDEQSVVVYYIGTAV